MIVKELSPSSPDFPERLKRVPTPLKRLFVLGADVNELLSKPCVTVVGSRKVSDYGRSVTVQLANDLAQAGIVIISGLAIGVDSLAHKAALDAGGLTIAVLPTGLDRVYPASNQSLARQILQHGGALVSEYPAGEIAYKDHFIARNRIAAGLGDVLLITEAAERSGTLSTARFALEQGKDVLAVPGNITSSTSVGTNNLIKSGAVPVTSAQDVFDVLGLKMEAKKPAPKSHDPNEQALLDLLGQGITDGDNLLETSGLEVSLFNQTVTMLEIRGRIRALGNNHWSLR